MLKELLPEREVHDPKLPKAVAWVRKSSNIFNKALKEIAMLTPEDFVSTRGWEDAVRGQGKRMFTADFQCNLASQVYALAIKEMFPEIADLQYVDFCCKNWKGGNIRHLVIMFTLEGKQMFIDGARGQIVGWHNKVVCSDWRNFKKYYDVERKRLELVDVYRVIQGIAEAKNIDITDIKQERDAFLYPFYEDPTHKRHYFGNSFEPRFNAQGYLLACLKDPLNLNTISEFIVR